MKIQLSDHFNYRKLLRFVFPSVIMMMFTSIYGVVDGFFVSNFAGKTPFAAVNLIIPALMILATVGFIFGTGGSAIVAKTLGEGNKERANEYFSLFVYIAFALGVIIAILGIFFIRPISVLLGATEDMLDDCILYGTINLIALPFFVLQLLFQSFFVTAERPNLGLYSTLLSGITNMILDAVLVILLPFDYKLAGAAVATAMSQVVGGVFPLIYFSRKNTSILRLGKTRLYGKALFKACTNGSSEFMNNISMSVVGILYNLQLLKYSGENGIAAYGVMMYVCFVFSSAFIGYSIGTAPIVSYHFGAKNHRELRGIFKKSLVIVGITSVCMVIIAELLTVPLSQLFVGYDKELFDLTAHGFRIFALSFLFMGYAMFSSGFFTALNDGITSAIISFIRTLVFQIIPVFLLPLVFGIDGIWISIVTAELMAVALSSVFLVKKRKKYHY